MKNKLSTLSYFIKRLKDNDFIVWKIFDGYQIGDPRKWTVMVNPGFHSVYITCYIDNQSLKDEPLFAFDDGGAWGFKTNEKIQTKSIQIIINKLIELGVTQEAQNLKPKQNG